MEPDTMFCFFLMWFFLFVILWDSRMLRKPVVQFSPSCIVALLGAGVEGVLLPIQLLMKF